MKRFLSRYAFKLRKAKNWLVAQIIFVILRILRRIPARKAIRFTEKMAYLIGPWTARHKLVLYNLERAFPEKSEKEREAIARDMWGNMARLAAEYVFVEELIDHDLANGDGGRIEVEGIERFLDLRDNPRPFIVFTAHTGNFELLPIIAAKYGLDVTALFRPPNNPYVAQKLMSARRTHMGHLVPSQVGAAWSLAGVLETGKGVGLLVDQKFHKGALTKFFGLKVRTNPLLVKLARNYDCEVYPARSIRLPNGRFRLEIEPAVELPRNENGQIDVAATAQLLNDKVESWVREYPGQWQWFHDRWNIKHKLYK
ncbi:lipid A biosynthesis lauroyl acyltransferase [Hoeflea sp. E7-10]|uniref:Lipid A biosynthesis lauroyl acyltransferase n=1 Tax=Hoeflea poritis TaxID=2993659 RepID=A0ABT4VIZ3_9HYPH|nr:lipid A biosynthesis lauroyl acyltransferase [Hoeflea poritis]MDA4844656.1 lipid A biosynthesis lauroyl acyltransferase [Hoeflea poritis]